MAEPLSDQDRLARRNAIILSAAQACGGIGTGIVIALGGIVGHALSPDKSLSTLPITTMVFGTMIATIPASLFMQRYGRRAGFGLGAVTGAIGFLVCGFAILAGNFWLFCLGTNFVGYFQSTSQFYRFAATDTASSAYKPKAISWALGGGLIGAILMPELIKPTKDIFVLSAGSFFAAAAVSLLAGLVVQLLRIPKPAATGIGGGGRPLLEIVRQPRFLGALVTGAVSFGIMNLVMTATPLAMLGCGFDQTASAGAIRWHVIAMYLPSFFVGSLITRFGRETIAVIGLLLLFACGGIALSGVTLGHFIGAMVALGFGWNFSYISATAIVADCHQPEERGKVQAFNDFVVFGFVTLCSFMSGKLLSQIGWSGVQIAVFPLLVIALAIILAVAVFGRKK